MKYFAEKAGGRKKRENIAQYKISSCIKNAAVLETTYTTRGKHS